MTKSARSFAPAPLSPISFDIPAAVRTTLDNGLRVVMFEDHRLPLVGYRLAFMSGDASDPAGETGLTSATASLLTEGTLNYTSLRLAETIERLGASLSANSSDDFLVVSGSSLAMHGDEVLRLMAEIVLRPTFPEEELDLYRRNTLEHLKFQRSQPDFLAGVQTARSIYGTHPYATVAAAPEDVERLRRERLAAYRKDILVPNNAVFIAVGEFEPDALLRDLNEQFGEWQPGKLSAAASGEIPVRSDRTLTIVDRPGSAQANIVVANSAFDRKNPDYFAVLVMNQILGAGASSRVFMNLREEKGYTYGAYTRFDAKRLAGDFEATAEVRTTVTGAALGEFFYELDRIRTEPVSAEELADAKSFLTGVFPIRAETQEGLTGLIANQELFGLPDDYLQTYRDKIIEIDTDDVARVANAYVRPAEAAIIIVGDAREVLPQVNEFASSISIVDTDGKPVDRSKFD